MTLQLPNFHIPGCPDMLAKAILIDEISRKPDLLRAELARLDGTLATLPCAGDCERAHPCSPQLAATCQGILDDFAVSLLALMQRQFAHEERHMKVLEHPHLRDVFERHKEAHANLTQSVASALVSESSRLQRYSLSDALSHWLTDHIATHDQALVQWLRQPA